MFKVCIMDDLREKHPDKFNESGAMDHKWFEAEIRPNYNVFVRKDVKSITISFSAQNAPISEDQATFEELLNDALNSAKNNKE